MNSIKFNFITFFILSLSVFVFAQDAYEAETDSAWIASQNGGSTEISNGLEEPNAACIGDGCDATESFQTLNDNCVGDTCNSNSSNNTLSDSSKIQSAINVNSPDSLEYEDCTPADSLLAECKEDEDDTYDRYLNENAEAYRARKEGFSRKIALGFRAAFGMNMVFGKKADNWNSGFEGSFGIFAKMPFFTRTLTLYPEFDFDYRVFNFESKSAYSEDEAKISQMLFEIPIILLFTPEDDGFFIGVGVDIGLKLSSESEYKQDVNTGKIIEKDKRKNTLPTNGVLIGGVFDIGYSFTRHFSFDIRVVQYFTNLINDKAVAETEIMNSKLYTFHSTLGISFEL